MPKRQSQGFQACFTRDHGFGAALGFVGQVQVFEFLLGLGRGDGLAQFGGQFALFFDALEDHLASRLKFAQVDQVLFQGAELNIIEPAGGFFAVAGDEGHGGPPIEQIDGRLDLRF